MGFVGSAALSHKTNRIQSKLSVRCWRIPQSFTPINTEYIDWSRGGADGPVASVGESTLSSHPSSVHDFLTELIHHKPGYSSQFAA